MNFTKNFKWQMVLVALGASLLMTGKAYSQEIDNTNFQAPVASVGSNFNTAAPATTNSLATPAVVAYAAAITPVAPVNEPTEASVTSAPMARGTLLAIAILLIGYAIVRKASLTSRNDRMNNWKSASTRTNSLSGRKPQVLHS
ncbi:MAG TPA: hypothetical protein VJX70_06340 [Candidatus Acidoferrum sp.]|nr:hypothetical protein [Candidatus Acidoferrum sp.]